MLLGVFAVATAASFAVTDYWTLFGSRVVTALSQALFWAVVTPAAAGLFPQSVRGERAGSDTEVEGGGDAGGGHVGASGSQDQHPSAVHRRQGSDSLWG